MAYYLLKEARVAIVPGDSFGADAHIRLSYATSMENLEKGMDRISEAMARLKTPKKVKRVALQNAVTRVKKPVPVDSSTTVKLRDALVAEMDSHLTPENYYEWNANISGVIVQLRTNVSHLYDFWVENWYPAQLEADLEPHGIIYAVDGIAGPGAAGLLQFGDQDRRHRQRRQLRPPEEPGPGPGHGRLGERSSASSASAACRPTRAARA